MALFGKAPIRRAGGGRYTVDLSEEERALLRTVATQVTELMEHPDAPGLHRSFPPAYRGIEHVEKADDYRTLMGPDLADRHREALATMVDSASATELDAGQMEGWMRALTQVRLVLGVQLGLEGNDDELPDSFEGQVYDYLTYVQSMIIEALSG